MNNYGYKLIEMCKRLNIYIGNSRLYGNDKSIGMKTCKDKTVVDYFLLSSNVFPIVHCFNVLDYNPIFSDVHCGLNVYLNVSTNKVTTTQNMGQNSKSNYVRWNSSKENEFVDAIFSNVDSFIELDAIINQQCQGNQVKVLIDNVVEKMCKIFVDTATSVFGTKKAVRSKIKSTNKPWYTKSCYLKRKQFNINRKKYNLRKTAENKRLLTNSGKEYKKEMKKSYSEYQKKCENELRNTSKKDAKKFWNILKSFSKSNSADESKISIDCLYEYFKKLNSSDDQTQGEDFSSVYSQNEIDLLNSEIKRTKSLKRSKT